MPYIAGIATAVPQYCYGQAEARDFARSMFSESGLNVDRLLPIFLNTAIAQRHFCMPAEWYRTNHSFHEKNRLYVEHALALSEKVVRALCEQHSLGPEEIDHLFFISTTGLATPSIDAHLFNRLKLKPSLRRTPIWGLGCAGGVAGLARAADWLKAYPAKKAVVIALELCSLTFISNDLSKGNFVATSLFADGAAGALLAGDACAPRRERGFDLLASEAITWPDSLDVMGWEIAPPGLKVLFSRDIPTIVSESARPSILNFLSAQKTALADVAMFLSHPGGAKVIAAYSEALAIPEEKTKHMWNVLRDYGNMSSATVLFVLEEYLRSTDYRRGELVLSTTLGPGFSSEMILGKCR
ncbi:MAG: 3-oxoacyl-[acyl-carrier-protein] synthase III C-terminal domain-containing protein [candidate division KSB1 bacterium]